MTSSGFFRSAKYFLAIIWGCWWSNLPAQDNGTTKIELLNADVSEFDENFNAGATRLLGNVRLRHESALMSCDSAYLYRDDNRLEAFGRIRIDQGDSMTLTGGKLNYDGNTRVADVFDRIVLTDGKMTLRTRKIAYNLSNSTATYTDSANIVDGENTLTSRTGFYYSRSKDLYFKKEVLLKNPKYTLTCDTLRYNTGSRTAFFVGPTDIVTDKSKMYCENGWYNTVRQNSTFIGRSYLISGTQVLQGDSIQYDQKVSIGKAYRHVSLTDTSRKMIIRGDYAEHHASTDSSWVTKSAEMVQYDERDSLFLHADTLLAIGKRVTNDSLSRDVMAFHHVKIYKSDLQGACDSLTYSQSDSTIRFFRNPILWSGVNQMTADSITLHTNGGALSKIILKNNAFLVSQADTTQKGPVDSLRFNQITGKIMTGLFVENEIDRIEVKGNGQTIYYARNKKNRDVAVNRADCSDLLIRIKGNEVRKITLMNDPDGTLYPIKALSLSELRLKGFNWQSDRRPTSRLSIFN
ncbi:MAG: OstA-like protein [Bacteroidota bacterium]